MVCFICLGETVDGWNQKDNCAKSAEYEGVTTGEDIEILT